MTAIYAGTFDPITNGHLDIIERASKLFDSVIVAIGTNNNKTAMFSSQVRMKMIKEATDWISDIVSVTTFDGLLVDYASSIPDCTIIRGIRIHSDFEYEMQMVKINRQLNDNIETVFLMPKAETEFISSTAVKELWKIHPDHYRKFVPRCVVRVMDRSVRIFP